jgi:hypothetical protein
LITVQIHAATEILPAQPNLLTCRLFTIRQRPNKTLQLFGPNHCAAAKAAGLDFSCIDKFVKPRPANADHCAAFFDGKRVSLAAPVTISQTPDHIQQQGGMALRLKFCAANATQCLKCTSLIVAVGATQSIASL